LGLAYPTGPAGSARPRPGRRRVFRHSDRNTLRDVGAGRLDFPATSMTVHRLPGWSSRSPDSLGIGCPMSAPSWASPHLRSSCSAPAGSTTRERAGPTCLSWDSSNSPPSTCLRCVHSHRRCRQLRPLGCHPRDSFRPRGFSPPRRFPPQRRSRACCIPQPTMGFVAFRASGAAARQAGGGRREALPATLFVPLEEFPSPAAAPCHHGRCLPAVTIRRPAGAPVRRSGPPHQPLEPPVASLRPGASSESRLQGLAPPTSP